MTRLLGGGQSRKLDVVSIGPICHTWRANPLHLHKTLKLKNLLQGNCPQRAVAWMREAIPGDPLVGKMSGK